MSMSIIYDMNCYMCGCDVDEYEDSWILGDDDDFFCFNCLQRLVREYKEGEKLKSGGGL